ncbi:MAG: BON domain-containing protein [Flavobacteriales bacterium]|nr:BON domain-containing protein [Flavobacteriales bacterium]
MKNIVIGIMLLSSLSIWSQSDLEIEEAIDYELQLYPEYDANNVKIRVNDHRVNVSGLVDNLYKKNRIITLIAHIKGVKAVDDQIDVVAIPKKESEISLSIQKAVADNPSVDRFDIHWKVNKDTVFMEGTVHSRAEKEEFKELISTISGVAHIVDDVSIKYLSYRSDNQILADVLALIENDIILPDNLIDVSVEQGVVYLSGMVGSIPEKRRAFQHAWVMGVQDVNDDHLIVERILDKGTLKNNAAQDVLDWEIKEHIENAFEQNPFTMGRNLSVGVDHGKVTLYGRVMGNRSQEEALKIAKNTLGVREVESAILVTWANPLIDENIEKRIKEKLYYDSVWQDRKIEVNSVNGMVVLKGKPLGNFETKRLENYVLNLPGVKEVRNQLGLEQHTQSEAYLQATRQADEELKNDIESQLFWSPFVDSDDITVEVKSGVATVKGEVSSLFEQDAVIENCYEGGAISVINELSL